MTKPCDLIEIPLTTQVGGAGPVEPDSRRTSGGVLLAGLQDDVWEGEGC